MRLAPRGPDLSAQIRWPKAWRIIATRFPPINLFERVSDKKDVQDALIALEQLTNPRLRDEIGEIRLIPEEKRVVGHNSSYVMAPFTHRNKKGSRFSNGTYGVYYAAEQMETALRETGFHWQRFARDSSDPPRREDMRVLVGSIDNTFQEVDRLPDRERTSILSPDSYTASQPFGERLRSDGAQGISYPSVRHAGGRCVAALWPDAVTIPVQERHLQYEWDGKRLTRYFDFNDGAWKDF